ncbi:MAG: GNAT family N-acetyltransferase [Pirellulales bacterium]|nr:GNAT family N-acetyltransferase [Pirellulales bacterium]
MSVALEHRSGLSIRHAKPDDAAAIVDLLREGLGEGTIPRSKPYWNWKHAANPFGPSPVLVAEEAGRIVGLRAFMRWEWGDGKIGQEKTKQPSDHRTSCLTAVRAVDTVTHPDFRGQGIFKRLTLQLRDEVQAEGTAFVFNTPNMQSRPGYLKMGWNPVGKPTLWIRPVRLLQFMKAYRRQGVDSEEGIPPVVDEATVGDVLGESESKEIIESAQEAHCHDRLHTPLSLAYLQWRYAAVPGFDYYAVRKEAGDEGALLIFRTRLRGNLSELRVCDVITGKSNRALRNARGLLRQAGKLADVNVVIGMPGVRHGMRNTFVSAGYLPVPRGGPPLTVYPFPAMNGVLDPTRLASWGPSIGDLELF